MSNTTDLGALAAALAEMSLDQLIEAQALHKERLRMVDMFVAKQRRLARAEKRKAPGRPKGSRNKPSPVETGEAVPA